MDMDAEIETDTRRHDDLKILEKSRYNTVGI